MKKKLWGFVKLNLIMVAVCSPLVTWHMMRSWADCRLATQKYNQAWALQERMIEMKIGIFNAQQQNLILGLQFVMQTLQEMEEAALDPRGAGERLEKLKSE